MSVANLIDQGSVIMSLSLKTIIILNKMIEQLKKAVCYLNKKI